MDLGFLNFRILILGLQDFYGAVGFWACGLRCMNFWTLRCAVVRGFERRFFSEVLRTLPGRDFSPTCNQDIQVLSAEESCGHGDWKDHADSNCDS